ncbi:hypothetical protein BDZ45DRAFT_740687 [Acephala macrosclerotiorum]|nr:hypothetical protein BDZ45DRAFT_740687 [Acephala macrosclerotiorum]
MEPSVAVVTYVRIPNVGASPADMSIGQMAIVTTVSRILNKLTSWIKGTELWRSLDQSHPCTHLLNRISHASYACRRTTRAPLGMRLFAGRWDGVSNRNAGQVEEALETWLRVGVGGRSHNRNAGEGQSWGRGDQEQTPQRLPNVLEEARLNGWVLIVVMLIRESLMRTSEEGSYPQLSSSEKYTSHAVMDAATRVPRLFGFEAKSLRHSSDAAPSRNHEKIQRIRR